MSSKALNWAWNKVRGLKGSEKTVLARLADWANDEGHVWLGKAKIAADCCLGKRTVDEAIVALERRGLIVVSKRYTEKGRRTSNLYQLQLDYTGQEDMFSPASSAGVRNSQGCEQRSKGVRNSQGEGADPAPEPPIEPKHKPQENSATDVAGSAKRYKSKSGKALTGKCLDQFEYFWNEFHTGWEKRGKAEAADVWFRLSAGEEVPPRQWSHVIDGAREEAKRRPALLERGLTPKMAEGWLSARRWEDYAAPDKPGNKNLPQLPWFRTKHGIEREAERFGVLLEPGDEFADLIDRLAEAMLSRNTEPPADLLAWRDQLRKVA